MSFLQQIRNSTPFLREEIERISWGSKYLAVLLKNGQIGVCATLGNPIPADIVDTEDPDLESHRGRILFIAYANATINYQHYPLPESDIFDRIPFSRYNQVVMIGLFQSLAEKFRNSSIHLIIFDIEKKHMALEDMDKQMQLLRKPGAVIMTSTTLVNNTFDKLIENCHPDSDVFMLGPSGILSEEFFRYSPIKFVFGSTFKKHDHKVLDIIQEGHGTRQFLPFLKKVYIKQKDNDTSDF